MKRKSKDKRRIRAHRRIICEHGLSLSRGEWCGKCVANRLQEQNEKEYQRLIKNSCL